MAKRRSTPASRQRLQQLPDLLVTRILPSAARFGAQLIADDAKQRLGGKRAKTEDGAKVLIADSVKVRVRRRDYKIRARILLDGPGAYVGRWIEYGTEPHFISVDQAMSGGRSARRVNYLDSKASKEGRAGPGATLIINGKPVGRTVHHDGARAFPFLRPALDTRHDEVIAEIRRRTAQQLSRKGGPAPMPEDDE